LKTFIIYILIVFPVLLAGCADIQLPTPQEVIKHPIGTESVKVGMTKDNVRELWGGPDRITFVEIDEGTNARSREMWYYKSFVGIIPVDAGYLSKPKYLYFDGESLTNISETPLKTVSEK